ncbi:MAG: RNA pseudouridine synthase [Desulfatiglandaceae bacterium]
MDSPTQSTKFFYPRWPVFHEDNHLLVIYKPALIPVQRGMRGGESLLDLAKKWLALRYSKPGRVYLGLVHRLDFPVAGVMVFARTSKAASRLSAQFREGNVKKTYLAVVEGIPAAPQGTLRHMIARSGKLSRVAHTGEQGSREGVLEYRVIAQLEKQALVEIDLITGRKHQIRLQFSDIGHPVLGDSLYGSASALPAGCIALMSRRMVFLHPTRKISMSFQSPVPAGWPWPEALDGEVIPAPLWTWRQMRKESYDMANSGFFL